MGDLKSRIVGRLVARAFQIVTWSSDDVIVAELCTAKETAAAVVLFNSPIFDVNNVENQSLMARTRTHARTHSSTHAPRMRSHAGENGRNKQS